MMMASSGRRYTVARVACGRIDGRKRVNNGMEELDGQKLLCNR